jgi:hypothetical protein
MGFGILVLPVPVIANLFSIPAMLLLAKKTESHIDRTLVRVGSLWCIAWLLLFVVLKFS